MNILITGGYGFLGSNLAIELIKQGHKVSILDYDDTMKIRLKEVKGKYKKFICDIRNTRMINKIFKENVFDTIYHLAGQVSHYKSMNIPFEDLEINVKGILNLLEAIRINKYPTKIVFASSRSVYGHPQYLPIDILHPTLPIDGYGISKLTSEHYCRLYSYHYNIPTVCLRMANLFGPRQQLWTNEYQMIGWMFRCAMLNQPIEFMGTGNQSRDFLYVQDAVKAYINLIDHSYYGSFFNLQGKTTTSWRNVVLTLENVFNRKLQFKLIPYTPLREKLEVPHSQLLSCITNWQPTTTLEDGLYKMKEYYESLSKKELQIYLGENS